MYVRLTIYLTHVLGKANLVIYDNYLMLIGDITVAYFLHIELFNLLIILIYGYFVFFCSVIIIELQDPT